LEQEFEQAIKILKCKKNKIPRSYSNISNKKIAKMIDDEEGNKQPSKAFMHIRLYSTGSEFIHRSYLSFIDGFVSVDTLKAGKTIKVLIPSPIRGIETAWWSSLILFDSIKWVAAEFDLEIGESLEALRNKIANLSEKWQPNELR
jgi:hypothetical protein